MENGIQSIELALALLICFLLGCIIGWLLRTKIFPSHEEEFAAAPTSEPAKSTQPSADKPAPAAAASPLQATEMPSTAGAAAAPAVTPQVADKPAEPDVKPATSAKSAPKATAKKAPAKKAPAKKAAPAKSGTAKAADKPAAAPKTAAPKKAPAAKKASDPDAGRPEGLAAPRDGGKDDLKQISGVGPKIEGTLNELGIYHFDQIATWKKAQIDWVDGYLKFKGRIQRDKWVSQAKKLAK